MRPCPTIMINVLAQHPFKVPAAADQYPVQAFGSNGKHPALRERVRPRGPVRSADDLGTSRREDFVEAAAELGIPVMDEKSGMSRVFVPKDRQIPCLLAYPCRIWMGGDSGEVHLASRELDEEKDVQGLQQNRLNGEEVAQQ